MFFDFSSYLEPLWQIILAAFLGGLIGLEREHKRKEAGLRTFALVSLGACFFTLVSNYFFIVYNQSAGSNVVEVDPTRVVQAVAIGIGFIGSGLIIQRKSQVEGLTTAAGLWATAALGIGIGLRLYFLSVAGALLVVVIFAVFQVVEEKFLKTKEDKEED